MKTSRASGLNAPNGLPTRSTVIERMRFIAPSYGDKPIMRLGVGLQVSNDRERYSMRGNLCTKFAIVAAACLLITSTAVAEEQEFAGNYQLISATRQILDTGQTEATYGEKPKGLAMNGKDGLSLFSLSMMGGPSQN
jgi:hypothetical protein